MRAGSARPLVVAVRMAANAIRPNRARAAMRILGIMAAPWGKVKM